MPELPDVVVYVEALTERVVGHKLTRAQIRGPFLLRSVTPPIDALIGRTVTGVRRARASGSRSGWRTICGSRFI